MKFSINTVLGLLGGMLLTGISPSSWAAVTVTLPTGIQNVVVPFNPPIISAGVDVPVGTVLYQSSLINKDGNFLGTWSTSDRGKMFYYHAIVDLINTPYPLAGLATGPFAGGVYQTGIPGIGVAILLDPNKGPITTTKAIGVGQYLLGSETSLRLITKGSLTPRYITLIKTGPITPGSYDISGANFPSVREGIENSPSNQTNALIVNGLPLYNWYYRFQGHITVSAQTCTTPDVSVTLGPYDISEHFTRINATTPWVDASIALTNCPTFSGFYNSTNAPLLMDYNTGKGTSTTSINNSIGVRLTPTTNVVDVANGVMAIDSTLPDAATGVGIQLGWGLSSQTPTLFNFNAEKIVQLAKTNNSTIRIPLAARYIQTADAPTPGKANGKLTFTINYY